jgi:gamma-glutamyltranspeptidase / glutathione hydrolase
MEEPAQHLLGSTHEVPVKGAVAAGHPLTQAAGSRILEAGGSAVDACVAAALVSWVVESPLTGPGGGGYLLVHAEGRTVVLDCFVAVPARGAAGREELLALAVDFDGDTQQVFHTGPAAVAVPGSALGLAEAHARWGRLPWPELFVDAVAAARDGFVLSEAQGYLHEILEPLLRHSPEGDAMYGSARAGDRLAFPELAATLELLASRGVQELYRGELARAICAHVGLAMDDLSAYRVMEREPLSLFYTGHEVRTNPPPSSGGRLIGVGLEALERGAGVVEAMQEMEGARGAGVGGTTHVSVVDADGCVAALSASLGSGSGVVVPGTGIHLNNMLGEADLAGVQARPGERLTSMMAPTLVWRDGAPRLVVGSAGSNRLRGAILQVVHNVVGLGMGVREAVDAPRVHWEAGETHCEPGADVAGDDIVRWRERNLFFGGASAVEVCQDGSLVAAGDPRRGGTP